MVAMSTVLYYFIILEAYCFLGFAFRQFNTKRIFTLGFRNLRKSSLYRVARRDQCSIRSQVKV